VAVRIQRIMHMQISAASLCICRNVCCRLKMLSGAGAASGSVVVARTLSDIMCASMKAVITTSFCDQVGIEKAKLFSTCCSSGHCFRVLMSSGRLLGAQPCHC